MQESSPSVVFIKDIELAKVPKGPEDRFMLTEDENAKVEGTGSGFIWDKFGHIVCMHLFPFYVINSKTCLWQM